MERFDDKLAERLFEELPPVEQFAVQKIADVVGTSILNMLNRKVTRVVIAPIASTTLKDFKNRMKDWRLTNKHIVIIALKLWNKVVSTLDGSPSADSIESDDPDNSAEHSARGRKQPFPVEFDEQFIESLFESLPPVEQFAVNEIISFMTEKILRTVHNFGWVFGSSVKESVTDFKDRINYFDLRAKHVALIAWLVWKAVVSTLDGETAAELDEGEQPDNPFPGATHDDKLAILQTFLEDSSDIAIEQRNDAA